MRLKDKIAVITGAATGIGAATAELFAVEGAKVVLGDINVKEANATVARIHAAGGEAFFVPTDVSEAAQINRLIQTAIDRHGRIDILHNNAAYLFSNYAVLETSDEDWEKSINTNLRAVHLGCKAVLPHMIRQGGGSIINTASVLSVGAEPNYAAYIASKGGIVALTRSIAYDYGKYRIRANSLCPGLTGSPPALASLQQNPVEYARLLNRTVLGRIAEPKEIAFGALFLASDESSYVTGTCLFVDGGWTCN